MALFVHNGFAWLFLTGVQSQFSTVSNCRLNLYTGTIPSTAAYSEAAFAGDLVTTWDQNFSLRVNSGTGGTVDVSDTRPILTQLGTFPVATATGAGTVTWGAIINPVDPTKFILSTVTGIGVNSAIIINNQIGAGNVINIGDVVTIVNFGITLATS